MLPEKIKPILEIDEKGMAIESRLVRLAAWMKEAYGGTMIQALKTVLPIKKKEQERTKRTLRLCLTEQEGKERLEQYLEKNQKARARVLAAAFRQPGNGLQSGSEETSCDRIGSTCTGRSRCVEGGV